MEPRPSLKDPKIARRLRREVARSVDAPAALTPHLDELFKGMHSLGSSPRLISRLLGEAGIGRDDRVLDLACGKGAVAVELARSLGCRVVGVDAHTPFLAAAESLAKKRGVDHLCTFRHGDLRTGLGLPQRATYHAAMMIGLDPLEIAAPTLRRYLLRGGVYVIDDIFRDPRRAGRGPDLSSVPTREECEEFIAWLGDELLAAHVMAPSVVQRMNARLFRALDARTLALGRERPKLRPALRNFMKRQREANVLLSGPLRVAVWIVRRP